jgi:hypothetical protein
MIFCAMARASKAPSPVDGYVEKASWTLQLQLDKAASLRVERAGDDATM